MHHGCYLQPLLLGIFFGYLSVTNAAAQSEAVAPAQAPASVPSAPSPATDYEAEPATPERKVLRIKLDVAVDRDSASANVLGTF